MEASCDTYIEGRGGGLLVFMRLVEVLVIRGFVGEKLWNNLGVRHRIVVKDCASRSEISEGR